MDATEFFKAKNPPSVFVMDDGPSGCKRSSIIRIRNEKKGMVSKSVETFTRPAMNATVTPSRPPLMHRTPVTPTTRRVSARMGVATAVRLPTVAQGTVASTAATRRQTLTGIRTTPRRGPLTGTAAVMPSSTKTVIKIEAPKIVLEKAEPIAANVTPISKQIDAKSVAKSRLMSDRRHDRPAVSKRSDDVEDKTQRKSKRLEGRRHLTIG